MRSLGTVSGRVRLAINHDRLLLTLLLTSEGETLILLNVPTVGRI